MYQPLRILGKENTRASTRTTTHHLPSSLSLPEDLSNLSLHAYLLPASLWTTIELVYSPVSLSKDREESTAGAPGQRCWTVVSDAEVVMRYICPWADVGCSATRLSRVVATEAQSR
jgi:hypothetical protein